VVKYLLLQARDNDALTDLPVASYLLNWIEHSNRQHTQEQPASSPKQHPSSSTSASTATTTETAVIASLAGNKGITAFSDKYFLGSWNFYCKELLDKTKQEKKPKRKKKKGTADESLDQPLFPLISLRSGSSGLLSGGGGTTPLQLDRHDEVLAGPEPYDPRQTAKGLNTGTVTVPPHSSITTDGSYLYILDSLGLAKVGTGHNNTIQVHIYLFSFVMENFIYSFLNLGLYICNCKGISQ